MKVTPLDLRQTHLSTSLRGFDRDEVRTLLTDAADDYEAALREVDRLRQDLQKVENQLGEHRDREINLRNTLLTAQKVADQIRENAGKEAEVLLRDAETRSQAMLQGRRTAIVGDDQRGRGEVPGTGQHRGSADPGAHQRGRRGDTAPRPPMKTRECRGRARCDNARGRRPG